MDCNMETLHSRLGSCACNKVMLNCLYKQSCYNRNLCGSSVQNSGYGEPLLQGEDMT